MTNKILEEIFLENQAEIRVKDTSYLEEKLIKRLHDKDRNMLYSLLDSHSEVKSKCSSENFNKGFRMGCQFMIDILKS